MATYKSADLDFSLQYPIEFELQNSDAILSVTRSGHLFAYGTDPKKDPEHEQAEKCMHTIAYLTAGPLAAPNKEDDSPDAIWMVDFDRTCLPKGLKGDKALTDIAGTMLHLPGFVQAVQQMWFQGGEGRHIHSGMAGETFTVPAHGDKPARDAALAIAASSFEQKNHYISVAYINGTREGPVHKHLPLTSVIFGSNRPVLLFPFMLGSINMIK